ncbi:MAG: glycogen synthase GlgA [Nitrospira sp.]|nr:glycogen synthase GlgA [Nitrospira sp.]
MKESRPLNLLIAASEAVPYAKTGGLADVVGALPAELAKLGHNVILMLPRYRSLDDSGRTFHVLEPVLFHTPLGTSELSIEEDIISLSGQLSVRVWALRHEFFFNRSGLYQEQGRDFEDNLERFAWFSRAVIEVMIYLHRQKGWKTDVLHLHDWQTALSAVYLKTVDSIRPDVQGTKTVLTLHNVGYQGIFPAAKFWQTGLPQALFTPEGLEFYGSVNLLKGGILFADRLTTVSPTYAEEILTSEFGFGLEGVLQARRAKLQGIINGIDVDVWNPETDPHLPVRYSADSRTGKLQCKQALQEELGLSRKAVPLLAVIARLTSQKGLDLVEAAIPRIMDLDLQLVVLGTGDPAHESSLAKMRDRFPDRMALRIGFDEGLAHRIEGGADIFLMPSRYEPCGLSQLYSLRYGTVPIVTKTGGLVDTVAPLGSDATNSDRATGFHIVVPTADAVVDAVHRAVRVYRRPALWSDMVRRGMKTDVSWAGSAQSYEELFVNLVDEVGPGTR